MPVDVRRVATQRRPNEGGDARAAEGAAGLACKPKSRVRRTAPERPGKGRLGAGNRVRTGDIQLGKLTLYQLSYARKLTVTGARGW